MTHPLRSLHVLTFGALAAVHATFSCGDLSAHEDAPEPAPLTTATIGPEGGRLELPTGNQLGVVLVDIPAGALSEPTVITVGTGLHSAPLPQRAFAVGPYIRFEPQGLTLSAPARLTLPVYDELRDAFGQEPAFVKVWLKGPDTWELYEQTSGGDGHVTIETTRLDVAGAGVKLPQADVSHVACVLNGACALSTPEVQSLDDTSCSTAEGYCLASLGAIDPPPLWPRLFGGPGYVAWFDLSGGASDVTLVARRISSDGATGAEAWPALGASLDVLQDTLRDRGAALLDDTLMIGALGGMAIFEPAASTFAPSAFPTLALAVTGDGRLAHFVTHHGRIAVSLSDTTGAAWGDQRAVSGLSPGGTLYANPVASGMLALATGHQLAVADVHPTTITVRPGVASLDGRIIGLATAPEEAAVLTDLGHLYLATAHPELDLVEVGVDGVHAVTSDGRNFWIALNNRPAVARLTDSGLVDVIRLAHETATSDEANALIPRAIASPAPGVLSVLTRGGELIRVRTIAGDRSIRPGAMGHGAR